MEEDIKGAIERLSKAQNDIWYATLYSQEEQDEDIKLLIKGYRELEEERNHYKGCFIVSMENSIPKSKVKEMIEKKQKRIDKMHPASDCVLIDDLENQIDVLQELLENE